MVSEHGKNSIAHVSVDAAIGRETIPIASDYECVLGAGADSGDSFFVRFYVDGGKVAGERFFRDGRRFRRTTEFLTSSYYGYPPPVIPRTLCCEKRVVSWGGARIWRSSAGLSKKTL